MQSRLSIAIRSLWFAAVCFCSLSASAQSQKPPPKPPDEVIRVNTDLVQTDVMVFDKQGHFVDGLQRDQFELNVDGKPQPISFFEQVKTGTSREQSLKTAGGTIAPDANPIALNENRGRTIVFFIDDLHLALDSLGRTRKMLTHFIDTEMGDNDRVAIASTSGDIGFLQQFTDNKSVLRAAVARLSQKPYNVRDMTDVTTPMTEYMALTIERKDDPGVLEFYIDECLRAAYPLKYKRASCEVQVKSRARLILLQAASVIVRTYEALGSLMHSAGQMPGRKLAFFISDGFLLDTGPRNSDPREKLNQITDAALRAGVVIYTIDARGLFSGGADATNEVPFDKQNRIESAALRAGPASQDALNAIAGDTGGRALRNQNYFDKWVNKVLDETANYYLLAWRPNNEEQAGVNFKNIAAKVIGHPEYTVRLPRGFLRNSSVAATTPAVSAPVPEQTHKELQEALTSLQPRREVPTSLSAIFLDTPEHGPVLTASVRVANETLSYEATEGRQIATIDVVGVVVNDRGKPVGSFQTRLKINGNASTSSAGDSSATIYNYRAPVTPGLYQVRIATRDIKNGQVGSAQQWIEIPDLALRRLSLSSLLLGLQTVEVSTAGGNAGGVPQVQFSTDHRFARNSLLPFMTFVYNAVRGKDGKAPPNVWLEVRILRGGQIVKRVPMQQVPIDSQDFARIPFEGEIALDSIPSGQYLLEVTVTDSTNGASASEQTRITIE